MTIFGEVQDYWYRKLLTKQEFSQFVENSLSGQFKDDQKAWIGNVTPEASTRIKNVCGKSVNRIMVSSSAIVHAYSKPSHNLLPTDIFRLAEVINSADKINVSSQRFNSEPKAPVLEFEAEINGILKFIELVRISKNYKGWLDLVTCYRKKKAIRDA